ncbi:CSD-domain-containing protein [Haematococcus lacustris]|uniref:CSD-domain-containing protein n=1 Tax=Haematococcus lacustris TaxID=44745 RepID=A0A699ZQ55_HAELA|nr:CSD-domain-containing protein [Haematococcus lacustris]
MGDSPAEGEPSSSFAAAYERHRGSVKWYNNTKGYGFVTPEGGGEDLFVHQSNINAPGYRSLREGEPVEYDGAPPKPRPAGYPQQDPSGRGGRGRGGRLMPMGGPPSPTLGAPMPSMSPQHQLKDCFREWKVERADIVEDQWGRSRGFGTVRFSTQEDAMAACAKMNNTQIDSRTISVRIDRFA